MKAFFHWVRHGRDPHEAFDATLPQNLKATAPQVPDSPPQVQHSFRAKLVSEFVGTFFLVFTVGCHVHSGNIGAALSIGAVLMVMVYALGSVSGAHFNPAVTLAISFSGRNKISPRDASSYMVVQIVAGILAASLSFLVFPSTSVFQPPVRYNIAQVCSVEMLYTCALCYVVLNVATTESKEQGNVPNSFFGLAIGFTVTSAAITVGPISGCALNPAVSIGGFVATKFARGVITVPFIDMLQYMIAPLLGSALAAVAFFVVQGGFSKRFEYPDDGVIEKDLEEYLQPATFNAPKRNSLTITKDMVLEFDRRHLNSHLSIEIKWMVHDDSTADINTSIVKFGSHGHAVAQPIYFANKLGQEDKATGESIIMHVGDNPEVHANQGKHYVDHERIEIRKLSKLMECQPRTTYLFIVVTIWTNGVYFRDVKDMALSVCDTGTGEEILNWSKKDFAQARLDSNAIIVGVMYTKNEQWYYKALEQAFVIEIGQRQASFRSLEWPMERIIREIEGTGDY